MAAYVVNQKWYATENTSKRAPFNDVEVAHGFMACIKKKIGDRGRGFDLKEFATFVQGWCTLGSNEAKKDLSVTDPIDWWTLHGIDYKELQSFATHLLS
eukprot:Gb_18287 [translate_table: standard]